MRNSSLAIVAAIATLLAGCSRGSEPSVLPLQGDDAMRTLAATGAGKIKHVVWIIQENRTFDNLFQGYPGADTVSSGEISSGKMIALKPVSLATEYTIDHELDAMVAACNGAGTLPGTNCRMNGFDKEYNYGGPKGIKYPMYVYVPHDESKPYFHMAHEWVVADRMFQSQLDASFVAHQYIISAQAQSSVDFPVAFSGECQGSSDTVLTITRQRVLGPAEDACFNSKTLGDELDAAGLSWRYYTSKVRPNNQLTDLWSGYQAIKHIYNGPDWSRDVLCCIPQSKFITDVRAGKLASFTWITPTCADSDHSDCGGDYGPSWVAALVNTIGKSKFWDSTAIFVQWDDWGGMYDHVPPPYEGYDSLGFRVPLLVISPYAKHGYVSHVQYETTSILRFAEDLFGLAQMTDADARATSPAGDSFDFTQKPRRFVPIKAPYGTDFFLHQKSDIRPPDDE